MQVLLVFLNKGVTITFEDRRSNLHLPAIFKYDGGIIDFVKKENYTGHTPKLIKNEFLMKYVYDNFINEFKRLENPENILLIPLGKAVEEILLKLQEDKIIGENQILLGFPHPSGANVNRVKQFEENKNDMEKFIKEKLV